MCLWAHAPDESTEALHLADGHAMCGFESLAHVEQFVLADVSVVADIIVAHGAQG